MRADVVSLAHSLSRIMRLEKNLKQFFITDPGRVKHDEHSLGMPGHPGADLVIGRIRGGPAGITDGGCDNAI